MSDSILIRLRHHAKDERNTAFARSTMREAADELAASRDELEGAKKAANAQARLIDSLEQQRAHLNAQRDQWMEARNTLDSERAANATLTEELAASREREARMRGALDEIAWGRTPGPLNNKLAQKYEQVAVAALAEGSPQ